MTIEIERRFLLKNNDWQKEIKQSIKMQQGYMSVEKEWDRKSTRLNSSHIATSRMPSSA